jgi:galactokinase
VPAVIRARGPGRVNLIGEHTDYNAGLALPFAIDRGVTVTAEPIAGDRVAARALDLDEQDEFPLAEPERTSGWRAFVRGAVAELQAAGHGLRACRLEIESDLQPGVGLSSSAAMETALCLALLAVAGEDAGDRVALAKLCSRIENDWVGAETGLLDQVASLCSEPGHAVRIDFATLAVEPVPLDLRGWTLVTLDSGAVHSIAYSGYNERRRECREACAVLGIETLREARDLEPLPPPLKARARHVVTENARVDATVEALRAGDLERVGELLDDGHASLRDDYECVVPEVEAAVATLKAAGAAGARMVGGGFGGAVLGLLPPGVAVPAGALAVAPGPPAGLD